MNQSRLTDERLAELRAHPWPMVPVDEFRALLDMAAENVKLREALKPFVEGEQVWSSSSYGAEGHRAFTARRVSVEAYDRARAVLGERSGK